MYKVAVIKDSKIINVVIADEEEAINTLKIFLPEMDDFIVETEDTGPAIIGGTFLNNKFVPPSMYPSWIFDENTWSWKAPKPAGSIPNGKYVQWNEELLDWELFDIPEIVEE